MAAAPYAQCAAAPGGFGLWLLLPGLFVSECVVPSREWRAIESVCARLEHHPTCRRPHQACVCVSCRHCRCVAAAHTARNYAYAQRPAVCWCGQQHTQGMCHQDALMQVCKASVRGVRVLLLFISPHPRHVCMCACVLFSVPPPAGSPGCACMAAVWVAGVVLCCCRGGLCVGVGLAGSVCTAGVCGVWVCINLLACVVVCCGCEHTIP